jgi:succinoglycan biosynthesis protein ExoA
MMAGGGESVPFVSVIVPMRNEERYIEGCLRSLLAQNYPSDRFEVLVVDGGSADHSRALAENFVGPSSPEVRLLDNPARTTARGLNTGLGAARGEFIARVDAHASVRPDFLSQSVAALEASGADVVGGPISTVGNGLTGGAIALAMSSPFGVGDAVFRYGQQEQWTDTVAFATYRRGLFDRLGLFADDIDRGEDDEFHYRLGEAGGRILLRPAIGSTYYARSSFPEVFSQYFSYGQAKVEVLRRHPGRARLRQLVPAAFVSTLLASAVVAPRGGAWALPLLAVSGAYATASLAASTMVAARRGWRYLPLLPLAFACLHVGYGLGFLTALAGLIFGRSAVRARAAEVSG